MNIQFSLFSAGMFHHVMSGLVVIVYCHQQLVCVCVCFSTNLAQLCVISPLFMLKVRMFVYLSVSLISYIWQVAENNLSKHKFILIRITRKGVGHEVSILKYKNPH